MNEGFSTLRIDLSDYWMIIRKRLLLIALLFILTMSVVALVTVRQTPVFQAECKVKISSRQPMATIEGAQITWYGQRGDGLSSEIRLMASKDEIFNQVIRILRARAKSQTLDFDPDHHSPGDAGYVNSLEFSPESVEFVESLSLDTLRDSYDIDVVPQSNIVAIKARSPHVETSEAMANLMAIVYRADFCRTKTMDAKETERFIHRQLEEVKQELEISRGKLERTLRENALLGSPEVYAEELTRLRVDLERLSEKYQDVHPQVQKTRRLLASVEERLERAPELKQEYNDYYAEWELKYELRRSLGEYLQKARIDYEAKMLKTREEIEIVSMADGAGKLRPNEMMNVLVGSVFGLIIACMAAFVVEALDSSIGKIEDVERLAGLPVIAHVPIIGGSRSSPLLAPFSAAAGLGSKILFLILPMLRPEDKSDIAKKVLMNLDPTAVAAEAYRTMRANLYFYMAMGKSGDGGKVVEITSSTMREGKTLTATNLAIEFAKMGKSVLLIEADMRRPQIAALFKIDEKPGLSDVLIETASRETAIRTVADIMMGKFELDKLMEIQGIDNLHILPCGTIPPNPAELLISGEFKQLVEYAKSKYEVVLIDTPPTLPVADSSIISELADGVVFVYQSDKTSRQLFLRALQTLRKHNAKLSGVVINQLSDAMLKSERGSGDYRYVAS